MSHPRRTLIAGALLGLCAGIQLAGAEAAPDAVYYRRDQAEAAAERLRARGQDAAIRSLKLNRALHHVELTFYQTQAAAELAAEKLRQYGARDARVLLPRERFGYAVSAGHFTSAQAAQERVAALRELGFLNVRVGEVQARVLAYRVEAMGRRTPPAVVAQPPATGPSTTPPKDKTAETSEYNFTESAEGQGADTGEVLSFGTSEAAGGATPVETEAKTFQVQVDRLRLEAGLPTDGDTAVDGSHNLSLTASLEWKPSPSVEARLGLRLDAYVQTGTPDFTAGDADYDEIYVRWRGESSRFTLGSQIVRWGRMDELSPTNLLMRQDLTRYTLDALSDRYRAQPALRYEYFSGTHKLEALGLPVFDEAALPERDSLWSPIDRERGQIQGFWPNPLLAELVRTGTIEDEYQGGNEAGGGLRYTHNGQGLDLGLSLLYGRPTTPYYEVDPAVRAALFAGLPPAQAVASSPEPTFQARYPATGYGGADLAFTALGATWRAELGYTDKHPVTTEQLDLDTVPAWNWAAGVELYPGDGNNRLTLQVNGRHLRPGARIADPEDLYTLSGELENLFAQDSWRLRTRMLASFAEGERDLYFAPELAWLKREPSEFYLGLHVFAGAELLYSGYHDPHDLIVLGWRTQF